MSNLVQMLKQAQQMQARMAEMQTKLAEIEVTGVSGGGMVQITVNGKGEVKKLKLDKSVVIPDEAEVLEDLILAAFNDAKARADRLATEEMEKLTGGLKLPPGMKLPF
jgi:DNA-binding YbaB/EbfC family protein